MRTVFITTEEEKEEATWAALIVPCEGGWMAFESIADYEVWQRQI